MNEADSGVLAKTMRPAELSSANDAVVGSASTLPGLGASPVTPLELDDPAVAPSRNTPPPVAPATLPADRGTVLPRRRPDKVVNAEAEARARFERVRLLGEGGMGRVELARDNDIRRTVAVKRLKGELCSDEALLRFADEVRIVGQLEHPAIVPIYDVGRDPDGQLYLVMKHLNGETMEQIIGRLRAKDPSYVDKFPIERRANLFLAVLDAMRYAHARGIIHRDLKPANIMIGPYGEVTILDWGIAKRIERGRPERAPADGLASTQPEVTGDSTQGTQLGRLAGTPLYMSPEQAMGRNDELDERSDVYALSLILLEWLSLEHPRRGKATITELLAAIISEDMPSKVANDAIMSGVSPAYVNVVFKGLARDPDKRLATVADLERELVSAISGRVQIVCHVTLAKRVSYETLAWIDRHPLAYLLIFIAVVLGVLAGAGIGLYKLFT